MSRLYKAVMDRNEKLVKSLIKNGVNKSDLDKIFSTMLIFLINDNESYQSFFMRTMSNRTKEKSPKEMKEQRKVLSILEMLILAGADYIFSDKLDYIALLVNSIDRKNNYAIDFLVKYCDKFKNQMKPDVSVFHRIVESFHDVSDRIDVDTVKNVIRCLVEHGFDINAKHSPSERVLMIEKCSFSTGLQDTYLVHGNAITRCTALHVAFQFNSGINGLTNLSYVELIKSLLEYGADVSIKDGFGWNAIERYLVGNNIDLQIMKLLPLENLDMSPLHRACIFSKYNDVRELARRPDVQIDAEDKLGNTPLLYVAITRFGHSIKDQESKMKLLLNLGADINRKFRRFKKDMTIINMLETVLSDRDKNISSVLLQYAAITVYLYSQNKGPEPYLVLPHVENMKYWNDYLKELTNMNKCMVDHNISFFDLLMADMKKSLIYTKNKKIVNAFKISLSEKKFPFYQEWLLHTNFGLALEGEKLLDLGAI